MDKAILLNKLINAEQSSKLYDCYINATSNNFENETETFNICIADLKFLSEKQYDFEWLKKEAADFGVSRRDFKNLCDSICVLLGDKINELCKYSKTGIVTKPTRYEDYCPFTSEDLVVYGKNNLLYITYDGYDYNIIETKLEETPYYTIYCSTIERM